MSSVFIGSTPRRRIRTLMVFIDGLGIGLNDPRINPLARPCFPNLRDLLRNAVSIDATLGVAGLPQSATGQTTLLTGVNAAQLVRRHVEGFPGPTLRALICRRNLLSEMVTRGYRAAFANAYYLEDADASARMRHPSVTTVAALSAFGFVRDAAHMMRQEAVYQDLTREALRIRGYSGPLLSPESAARHLLGLAKREDFTLFEYFQTDRVAHRGNETEQIRVLDELDRFLGVLRSFAKQRDRLFVLCSDHGNLEDSRTSTHTMNPVPFVAIGSGAKRLKSRVRSLIDVTPELLNLYPGHPCFSLSWPAASRVQKAPNSTVAKVVIGDVSRKSSRVTRNSSTRRTVLS